MKYLIIGGGPCGDSAAKEIRKLDKEGEITLITEEVYPPYRRLSLTKQAWSMPFDSMALNTEKQGVNVVTGVRAESLDEKEKTVEASDGKIYTYVFAVLIAGAQKIMKP